MAAGDAIARDVEQGRGKRRPYGVVADIESLWARVAGLYRRI